MKSVFEITGLLAVLSIATAASGQAADPGADAERLARRNAIGKGTIHHNAHPDGILPLIDYSGDLWSRSTLTGDWGGVRESLAAKGISTDLSFATVLQGVAHGGANTTAKVGTSMDLGLHLDFMRMGLIPGGLLSLRAEGDFSDSVLEDAGTITAVNRGSPRTPSHHRAVFPTVTTPSAAPMMKFMGAADPPRLSRKATASPRLFFSSVNQDPAKGSGPAAGRMFLASPSSRR